MYKKIRQKWQGKSQNLPGEKIPCYSYVTVKCNKNKIHKVFQYFKCFDTN